MNTDAILAWLLIIASFGVIAVIYHLISPFKRRSASEFVSNNRPLYFLCSIMALVFIGICFYLTSKTANTDIIVLALSILTMLDSAFIFDLALRKTKEKTGSVLLAILFFLFGIAGSVFLYGIITFWGF